MSQELVNKIDPNLLYLRDLSAMHKDTTLNVFEVGRCDHLDKTYTLKFSEPKKPEYLSKPWVLGHLPRETEVLTAAKGLIGIPSLEKSYYQDGYLKAILKEFIPGIDFRQQGRKVDDPILHRQLHTTVDKIHGLGYAGLELDPKNLVLYKGILYVLDFGTCVHKDDGKPWFSFEWGLHLDDWYLKRLAISLPENFYDVPIATVRY